MSGRSRWVWIRAPRSHVSRRSSARSRMFVRSRVMVRVDGSSRPARTSIRNCWQRSRRPVAPSITSCVEAPTSMRSITAISLRGPMTATVENDTEVPVGPAEPERERLHGGWRIVARKEFTDHIHSVRFVILVVLMALAGLASVHSASGPIRSAAAATTDVPSIFLYLFTLAPDRVPAFHEFLGILGPLLGIAFGFDAVNGERAQRTLPRLVAQPIHRDEVINGKFVAGLGAIALALAVVMAVVVGYGMLRLGIGPTTADFVRMLAFFVVAVVYIAL